MIAKLNLAIFFALVAGMAPANATEVEPAAVGTEPVASTETVPSMFKFGGFGTLGASHSSQSLGDYVLDGTIPQGTGHSKSWAWGNDSRIGAQLTANLNPKTSAVLQVISEYQADKNYRPTIEWANVKYEFTPDAYFRLGRIALPTFLDSDSRKIGYSYPWIHPPVDLYRQLSITNSDGVDAMYRFEIGRLGNSIKAIYGRNENERPTSISTSRGMWGLFDTVEYGAATFRIGYQMRESSSRNLLTGVTGAWVQNSDLSVGFSYDPGRWFAMSEWMQRESTSKIDAMYVSAGCRVNQFTPYLTYSQNSPATILPGYTGTVASSRRAQSTISFGTRWNLHRKSDVTLQYDQVKLSNDSNGYLANVPTGVILYGTKFHVISATFDFLF